MKKPVPSTASLSRALRSAPLATLALALWAAPAVHALTIVPTFEGPRYTPVVQAAVTGALTEFSSRFSDDIVVYIRFLASDDLNGSVGRTNQDFWPVDYAVFLTALRNDAASADDATVLAHLPSGTGALPASGLASPVPGSNRTVWLTRPHAAALGLNIAPVPDAVTKWDAVVDLDLPHMFFDSTQPDPSKYDLRGTVLHEVSEVLGTTSNLADFSEGDRGIRPVDLFRYQNDGSRSYSRTGDNAWFSLDGTRLLARFNQDAGGDYGDFWSPGSPADDGRAFQVQDAFNWPGLTAELNVELRMLDVIGFDPVLPAAAAPEIQLLPSGDLALTFHLLPFQDYVVQRSEDLTSWQTRATATADKDGLLLWTDTDPPAPRGFYRAAFPPSAPSAP
ncbi:MAG: hypothetical protein JWL81_840 [Verrucomicrobiales bacterium]|nr:hypothetical protein [Verrucomicrobiales bacterium]